MRDRLRPHASRVLQDLRARAGALAGTYALVAVVLGAAAWAGKAMHGDPLYYYLDPLSADGPGLGAMTWVSSLFLLVAAGFYASTATRIGGAEPTWPWWGGAVLLATMAIDESLMLHESFAHAMNDAGVPPPLGFLDHDVWIFALYAIVAGIVGLRTLPRILASGLPVVPLMLAAAFFAGSQFFDMIPWKSLTYTQRQIVGPLEEMTKTLGCFSVALHAALIRRALTSPRERPILEETSGGLS